MRTQVRLQRFPGGRAFRVTEADGSPVVRWLPLGPYEGPLDDGGFATFRDARAFALGVDLVRAEAGLCDERIIRAERAELDDERRTQRPMDLPAFEAA